ncbi:MAG TPA: DUF374 domain-containing protein [Oceanipulchritudo sp.]|nr:DUF374 domain-containing protein [Oceanipulchritudo sp.]
MNDTANLPFRINEVSGPQRRVIGSLGRLVKNWQKTLTYSNLEGLQALLDSGQKGAIFLLWHNRIFPVLGAFKQIPETDFVIHALVSASRDGARLSHFLEAQGLRTVRGSSSRRAAAATRELLRILNAGEHVAITVDGPRGPCYRAQAGAALLVQATGAPVYFLGAESETCRELDSWDRFLVPAPWSRVRLTMDKLTLPTVLGGREQRREIQARIQAKLAGITFDLHREA